MARRQQQRRQQGWLLAFFATVLVLVVAIPAYGYYASFVAPPRRVVASVNGVDHTLGEMVKLVVAQAAGAQGMGQQPDYGTIPFNTLFNLVNDELIRQTAPSLSVSVSQEEVDAEVRSRHYPKPPEGQQTDPAALEREFQESYRQYLNLIRFSDAEYRDLVKGSLFQNKVRELVSVKVPALAEQVYAHWIQVRTEADASAVQEQLKKGEAFDRVARISNIGDSYSDDNGEVGWIPKGAFPELDFTLFGDPTAAPPIPHIAPDTISEPILGQGTYFLVKITQGPELREVSDTMRNLLKNRALDDWLNDQRSTNAITVNFGSPEYEWVVRKVQEKVPPLQAQQG